MIYPIEYKLLFVERREILSEFILGIFLNDLIFILRRQ